MKALKLFLVIFLIFSLSSSFDVKGHDVTQTSLMMTDDLTYSWNPSFEAVSYIVDIEHQSTNEQYSNQTTGITTTFYDIPVGTYDIVVTGVRADQSTFIVIGDELEL